MRPYFSAEPKDKELNALLNAERSLQAEWYARMSGQGFEDASVRRKFEEKFKIFSMEINKLKTEKGS